MAQRRIPDPERPAHPERICWGCPLHCAADALGCGNGTIRTPHPVELFGDDWVEWIDARAQRRASRVAPDDDDV
jgi:hypothetical protein